MPKSAFKKLLDNLALRRALPAILAALLLGLCLFLLILPAVESQFSAQDRDAARKRVDRAWGLLEALNREASSGRMSGDRARAAAISALGALPRGPDLWVAERSKGLLLGSAPGAGDPDGPAGLMAEAARTSQSGVLEAARWTGPDGEPETGPLYFKAFRPWGWVLGAGVPDSLSQARSASLRTRLSLILAAIFCLAGLPAAFVIRKDIRSEKKRSRIQRGRENLIKAMAESEERYRTVADFTHDWETWRGPDETMRYCSPSCQRITGYPPEKYFEDPGFLDKIIHPEDLEAWRVFMASDQAKQGETFDFRIIHRTGQVRWLSQVGQRVYGRGKRPLGVRYSRQDITERKVLEEHLRHQAFHDALTSLANRTLSLDRIRQAMERAKRRERHCFAVVFMDLDRFKAINDSLGHRYGDMVLMETARRILNCVRSLDTVSRYGGDEFVLLLDELSSPAEAIRIVRRIRDSVAEPYVLDDKEALTSASFGVVFGPALGRAEDLVQDAGTAMHRAKGSGRNRIKVFNSRMRADTVGQTILEKDLERAMRGEELFLLYQPIFSLPSSDLAGFEALIRWRHPKRGVLEPDQFIPLAEESGLINELGLWVLKRALSTLASWQNSGRGPKDLFVSVNISGRQLFHSGLPEKLASLLAETGIRPQCLRLELSESAAMENVKAGPSMLSKTGALGVHLSIDDFGAGHSSFAQILRLPVNALKMDRSIVSRIDKDPESMDLARAVVAMAHSLGLIVVAEGVEQEGQLSRLKDLKCESAQGFYFHRPLDQAEAEALL
ncbi:MAG: EAL domain-containing protein, partial [Desulfovibrionaceae bacterium]|nr:EAL domain-containing protein [Desulfovibrionaceae bacterium]